MTVSNYVDLITKKYFIYKIITVLYIVTFYAKQHRGARRETPELVSHLFFHVMERPDSLHKIRGRSDR